MKFSTFSCTKTPSLAILCLIYVANAFTFDVFGPTTVSNGGTLMVRWFGAPSVVNVELAAQNKDTTLITVGQTTFNVQTTQNAFIRIDRNTPLGINYYLVAVDVSNSENFATFGPITVYDYFSNPHPSSSVVGDGTATYNIAAKATTASSTAAKTITTSTIPTSHGSSGTTASVTEAESPTATSTNKSDSKDTNSPTLTTGAIAGISVGGVCTIALLLILFICILPAAKKQAKDVTQYWESIPEKQPTNTKYDQALPISDSKPKPVLNTPAVSKPEVPHSFHSNTYATTGTSELHAKTYCNYPFVTSATTPYPVHESMPSPVHFVNDSFISHHLQHTYDGVLPPHLQQAPSSMYGNPDFYPLPGSNAKAQYEFSQKEENVHKPNC